MVAVLAYGFVLAYLLAVLPAAAICARKRRWAMLFAGFLTFGLVWCIGAAAGESRRTLGFAAFLGYSPGQAIPESLPEIRTEVIEQLYREHCECCG